MYWYGALYSSGTISTSSNSGWLSLKTITGSATPTLFGVLGGRLTLVGAAMTVAETLDVDMDVAFDVAGTNEFALTSFAQMNTAQSFIPIHVLLAHATGEHIPPFIKFTWTVDGATDRSFIVYGTLEIGITGN